MHPSVAFHDELATRWEAKYTRRSFTARQRVLDECLAGRNVNSWSWLDAGCGTGTLSRWLVTKGCRVRGVDASASMIEIAREETRNVGRTNVSFECVRTVEDLPDDNEMYDGVLCSSVLEYLDSPDAALAEFARVLRRGGILLASVPNRYSLIRRALVVAARSSALICRRPWPVYVQFSKNEYSPREFRTSIECAGLDARTVLPFAGPVPAPLSSTPFIGSLLMCLAIKR